MRTCSKCKIEKDISKFHKRPNRKSTTASWCKKCVSKWKKEHYNKEYKLKAKYGIGLKEYNIYLVQQNGKCAICKIDHSELKRPLSVDHSHKTSKIRGLLCNKCNMGLGMFNDDIGLFLNVIQYLRGSL